MSDPKPSTNKPTRHVGFQEQAVPLTAARGGQYGSSNTNDDSDAAAAANEYGDTLESTEAFVALKTGSDRFSKSSDTDEFRAADRLSIRLLAVPDDDEEEQDRILRESLQIYEDIPSIPPLSHRRPSLRESMAVSKEQGVGSRFWTMCALGGIAVVLLAVALYVGVTQVIGPPSQPVGPYTLVERQEGHEFFGYYNFYEGRDSVGSNGYLYYVSEPTARTIGLANVTMEPDVLDLYATGDVSQAQALEQENIHQQLRSHGTSTTSSTSSSANATTNTSTTTGDDNVTAISEENRTKKHRHDDSRRHRRRRLADPKTEPFVYMGSAPTAAGPRDSIRLEGKRRFNRGLFIIDIRHMPAGCGVWPAFWLTDEANWPVNGEIDIVEGVNYQSQAKTALHSTKGCVMDDIPQGVMTGGWDTAVGIPDKKTGIPDMTMRYAKNCFVYDPHQWLNQGCVAVDEKNHGTLGGPLNQKGGGVFALEWDPVYRHIRSWVFTPHSTVPDNLRDAIRTARLPPGERVEPDPESWPLPYGYYAIGQGTNCPSNHFKNMRLVFNLAFCGSVAGNRFQLDCPAQAKKFKTCNDWIKSNPDELLEAYWKIRGVYVYERTWERAWMK